MLCRYFLGAETFLQNDSAPKSPASPSIVDDASRVVGTGVAGVGDSVAVRWESRGRNKLWNHVKDL